MPMVQFKLGRNNLRNLVMIRDFLLDNQPWLIFCNDIDDDIARNLVHNNSRISTKEIVEKFNIDKPNAFRHFKKILDTF